MPSNNAEITISNIYGQSILNFNSQQKEVNIQIQKSGVYFIQAKTNNKILSEKVIVTE
ncbi:MAG: T9SS type A sorting domain-containing protein [Bacteroidetes bacterium]|nr:T9SS type A sorting domain-containing protein [Bacteroidota bacterium]